MTSKDKSKVRAVHVKLVRSQLLLGKKDERPGCYCMRLEPTALQSLPDILAETHCTTPLSQLQVDGRH